MKVLLDECVPRKLKREIANHEVVTVTEQGWSGIQNGELLNLAATKFDVFLTVDQNLSFQQNIKNFNIAIILMVARNNRLNVVAVNARSASCSRRGESRRDRSYQRKLRRKARISK